MFMDPQSQRPGTIEDMLRELREAEAAGVFRRANVQADRLLADDQHESPPKPLIFALRRPAVAVTAAAVLLITAGVWIGMFRRQINDLRMRANSTNVVDSDSTRLVSSSGSFQRCVQGPSGTPLDQTCRMHDYDADGDVDLADFRAYQLAYADTTR